MHMTFTEAAAMFLLTKFPCITCVDEISRLQSLVVGKAGTSKLQVSEPTQRVTMSSAEADCYDEQ